MVLLISPLLSQGHPYRRCRVMASETLCYDSVARSIWTCSQADRVKTVTDLIAMYKVKCNNIESHG